MNIKSNIIYYFDKWWRPVLFLLVAIILMMISFVVDNSIFLLISFFIFLFAGGLLVISLFYQLWKRRWLNAFFTFLVLGLTAAISLFSMFALFFAATEMPDRFADDLTIPTNIKIYMPVEENKSIADSVSNAKKNAIDLEIFNSFQPGLYEYEFWTSRIERGTIYLKAFEVTQNEPLSTDRLESSTTMNIENSTDTIMKVGTKGHFTIYEGDWGKPYAARFEVWYKPATGDKEKKLLEKNYQIEGWQR